MVGVLYSDVLTVKGYLSGQWGPDAPVQTGGSANTRDVWIANEISVCSRLFDRQTGRPSNWWQSAPGTTRAYSGTGDVFLSVDEWDAITQITMSSKQDRSDAVTLSLVPGQPDYVAFDPTTGPPFDRLYLLRGWLPDVYDVGNVQVTGTPTLPPEIQAAVAIWVAYRFKRRDAGFSDPGNAAHAGNPGPKYAGLCPPEVQEVITYYRERFRNVGPHAAMVAGSAQSFGLGPGDRKPLWMGWQTQGDN